jgi:peptidyl-tRNA hydrolase
VQGAHASIAFLTNKMKDNLSNPEALWWVNLSQAEKEWVYGTFFKVCVGVDSEKELLDIGYNAVMLGLSVKYIEETTGFDKPTVTCIAIGPDYSSVIDPVTKHLKLL